MDRTLPLYSWPSAPVKLKLEKNEVHVWFASLNIPPVQLKSLKLNLASDELDRAERFRFQRDRDHYIAAHGILREIISCYLKKDPSKLKFIYNGFGKPFLEKENENLSFNLSHSRDMALYAFTWGRKIGIDIECIRLDVVTDSTAEHTFSNGEVSVLRSLPEEIQSRAFFNCWTRKEAYIKAKGRGLSIPLDQFDVSLVPGEPARLMKTSWDASEPSRWKLEELNLSPQYVASLAVEGCDWHLKCWRMFNR